MGCFFGLYKNLSIFITIFKNRIFFVLHKQKPSFFGSIFGRTGRSGSGRAGSGLGTQIARLAPPRSLIARSALPSARSPLARSLLCVPLAPSVSKACLFQLPLLLRSFFLGAARSPLARQR